MRRMRAEDLYRWILYSLILCNVWQQGTVTAQRLDKFTCERKPIHTQALKTPGDNGFSIKILGSPPPEYYEPGKDYQVLINGSYTNQQFLDFMLVAVRKGGHSERDTAGTFTHTLSHMTKADDYCSHVLTSVTFHPSYKKSSAQFIWTAPARGSGCVIFRSTIVEHPDIWYSNDGGLTKMFCEKPEETSEPSTSSPNSATGSGGDRSSSHSKRQSGKCCACDVAKYEVTFIGNWTRESHPKDFPSPQYESLLHWSDIIGASHSPSYSIWSYGELASTGVKEVCEYGWPRTLEGEIKRQGRNVRTVIKTSGVWGYPAIYTQKRTARFSTDNERPYMSLLTMVGPSPDWCIGVDSINLCSDDCSWVDQVDVELYPWDAGTDSGVTYLSSNLPTFPRERIRNITDTYPNNPASPFFGLDHIKPMGTVRVRRVGSRLPADESKRCEAKGTLGDDSSVFSSDSDEEEGGLAANPKCMTTEWSEFSECSVTCGVGVKTRSRQFKHPMGSVKLCPLTKIQEMENCLGLVNECDVNPDEPFDVCVTTPWSNWSPCSVTCGSGSRARTRQYLNAMGTVKCSQLLADSVICTADIPDCEKASMMVDWRSICTLPAETGRCVGSFERFFYNSSMGKCQPFEYGGCRGNQNRFDTMAECERRCVPAMEDAAGEQGDGVVEDIDCMVTEWTPFSDCSVSCGTGIRTRSKMIKLRNRGGGQPCPKDLYETRVCASQCPDTLDVDCMITEWAHWSDCTTTCGDGVQIRQRMVKRPAEGQGQPCPDGLKEMRECNLGDCIVEDYSQCMLMEWSDWSVCSQTCGVGKMMRQRIQKRGPCHPDTSYAEAKICEGLRCGASRDCVLSAWSGWTDCDKPCDFGTQTRFRMITEPATAGGSCELDEPKEMAKRACYLQSCDRMSQAQSSPTPLDCQVSEWGEWSPCSKTCGTGRQFRRREVTRRRQHGGARCPSLKDKRRCATGIKCRRRRVQRLKH